MKLLVDDDDGDGGSSGAPLAVAAAVSRAAMSMYVLCAVAQDGDRRVEVRRDMA